MLSGQCRVEAIPVGSGSQLEVLHLKLDLRVSPSAAEQAAPARSLPRSRPARWLRLAGPCALLLLGLVWWWHAGSPQSGAPAAPSRAPQPHGAVPALPEPPPEPQPAPSVPAPSVRPIVPAPAPLARPAGAEPPGQPERPPTPQPPAEAPPMALQRPARAARPSAGRGSPERAPEAREAELLELFGDTK